MRTIHGVSVAALLGTVAITACGGGNATQHGLDLALASSRATYASGTPVVLTVSLTNGGAQVIRVSHLLESNIRIVSLTKDGAAVIQNELDMDTDVDLRVLAADRLVDLAPGASTNLTWTASDEGPQGQLALFWGTVAADGTLQGRFAPVVEPGHYTLSAVYLYAGAADSSVFTDSSTVGQVSFDITP